MDEKLARLIEQYNVIRRSPRSTPKNASDIAHNAKHVLAKIKQTVLECSDKALEDIIDNRIQLEEDPRKRRENYVRLAMVLLYKSGDVVPEVGKMLRGISYETMHSILQEASFDVIGMLHSYRRPYVQTHSQFSSNILPSIAWSFEHIAMTQDQIDRLIEILQAKKPDVGNLL